MDNVPYEAWADCLQERLAGYGIQGGLVLDLGCGTGTMTECLAARGFDMIGVDSSQEMLGIAARKRGQSGHDILYLLQDMCAFELYGTVRAAVSVCDAVNYILDGEELEEMFRLVNNYLDPGGIFIFDFNTEYKYRQMLGSRVIAEERGECSFIWDNEYDVEDGVNEYELTLFIREDGEEELYRKYQETHFQKAYTLGQMKEMLERAGLTYMAAYDGYTREAPREDSERISIVARESGKNYEKDMSA